MHISSITCVYLYEKGETPSKAKGKSAKKSEDREDEKNNILPASSNFDIIQSSPMYMNEYHFVKKSRLKGGTSWPSDNHQQDGKPPDGSKGFISNIRSMWRSPGEQLIITHNFNFNGLVSLTIQRTDVTTLEDLN